MSRFRELGLKRAEGACVADCRLSPTGRLWAGPWMTPDGDTFRIEYERLWSVFGPAPLMLSVTMLNAILVAAVLSPADGARLSAGWAASGRNSRWIGSARSSVRRISG